MAQHITAGGLPEYCFAPMPSDPTQVVILKRGMIGYYPTDRCRPDQVTAFNEGLTLGQLQAMLAGAMFGWDVPAADPANYDDDGKPLTPLGRPRLQRRRG